MNIAALLRVRTVIAVFAALIIAAAAYGFAAANTVTTSSAGDGTGTISGYTVVTTYVLNSTNPDQVDTVNLTVTPLNSGANATTVKVRLEHGGSFGAWKTATGSGTSWSVDVSGDNISVSGLTQIRVVAAS
jgi:hypothetical protein